MDRTVKLERKLAVKLNCVGLRFDSFSSARVSVAFVSSGHSY
jgi:hypothetical protein